MSGYRILYGDMKIKRIAASVGATTN